MLSSLLSSHVGCYLIMFAVMNMHCVHMTGLLAGCNLHIVFGSKMHILEFRVMELVVEEGREDISSALHHWI